ncbi:DJ-1/PfpI family protein [Kibdelosporangium phytohabitans]|uniref:Thiamine biosynthesis protein ThiJ n=1 Tax=Kibdelosporangium phytohabitans TaxID=860235 RepID=A0A0N9I704_9PSEU|nr:DJ-1/PfpI family protein [Kibdelosporangium phytohabitans]ALG10693.1 thiamine biosynthesis protein ThiJ [Kibdelosporangium phytohabitans]MBE1461825.1 transcriptional regulator GlxA family with amidase domain [Kibdelosporangium phytohabitans]
MTQKTIACVVFPGLTPLDLVGPVTMLGMLTWMEPEYELTVVGARIEEHETDAPLRITPSHTFDQVRDPAVLVVPGGAAPAFRAMTDKALLGYLRAASASAEITASVCSGSLLLGAAGLLKGKRATTHWTVLDLLAEFDATPVRERWVEDGDVITAAGVSAGIDMGLYLVARLAGQDAARIAQFGAEYDPEPPFGPLDWDAAPRELFAPAAVSWVTEGLAGDPDLSARLRARL